jgi:hypothetical protein
MFFLKSGRQSRQTLNGDISLSFYLLVIFSRLFSQYQYSWLWLQTKLKWWWHFFIAPLVINFMPDISDTGGDTGAQSQYPSLWLQTKLKWWHFFTVSLVVYFVPDISDTAWRWHWCSISKLLALLAPDKVKMTTFLYCSTSWLFYAPISLILAVTLALNLNTLGSGSRQS